MFDSFTLAHRIFALTRRSSLMLIFAAAVLLFASNAQGQFGAPSAGTHVNDASALHPPTGARVAIVEFSDFECPACAHANPTVMAAVATYKIPWVRHDFLIPGHIWSTQAAVNARWFDLNKSKAVGEEYRNQVFASQSAIYNLDVLRQFTQKFAQSHGVSLPFAIDPQGKLLAEVKADSELGRRTGIQHTPTVFIVIASGKGAPFREVQSVDQDLYQTIDQALADTAGAKTAPKAVTKPAVKKPATRHRPTKQERRRHPRRSPNRQ
jgi:protein-disulfide isomerase